jgi:WD40 repeat protein
VQRFDVKTGKRTRTLGLHTDVVYGMDFTPDGSRLVTASGDKTLRFWNVATGEPLNVLKDHADGVYAVKYTQDGSKLASTGVDRSIKVWDAARQAAVHLYGPRARRYGVYACL